MKFKIFTVLLSIFAFCVFYCPGEAFSLDQREAQDDTVQASGESPDAGTAAQKIYIDPETGEFIAPSGQGPFIVEKSSESPKEALEETPSPVPGGGMIIDLKGHFRPSLTIKHDFEKRGEQDHEE
ncbi:MAG: hypothetical protein AB1847_17830 [bacterium]